MEAMQPCFDVRCHIEVSSNCVPVASSQGLPLCPISALYFTFRGVKFKAQR